MWFASDGVEYSAKLKNALEARVAPTTRTPRNRRARASWRLKSEILDAQGAERQQLWDDLNNFLVAKPADEEPTSPATATEPAVAALVIQ